VKLLYKIIKFFVNGPVDLNKNEKHCDCCNGSGWVEHHCGDSKCKQCNGNGWVKI